MNNRGILYIIWGNRHGQFNDQELLDKSIESIKKYNLPFTVKKLDNNPFGLLYKSNMYDISPYENTLYLDNDTIVLDDLSFGFDQSEKHGMALCHDRACELERWQLYKHLPEYNTGVIFFHKGPKVEGVFNSWQKHCDVNRSYYPGLVGGNDQPIFSIACYEKEFNPYILPETWNYRRYQDTDSIFGNIKIWHTTKILTKDLEAKLRSNNEWKFYTA